MLASYARKIAGLLVFHPFVATAQTIALLVPLADIDTAAPGHEKESVVMLGELKFTVPLLIGNAFR